MAFHSELQQFVRYDVIRTHKTLGMGSFGTVEELVLQSGALCAGKMIHKLLVDPQNQPQGMQRVMRNFAKECSIMSKLRHPNIVQFLGICFFNESPYPVLVMERLDLSLDFLLHQFRDIPLQLSRKMTILLDVVMGLRFLHNLPHPIIHRDLTARNVLLNKQTMRAKIVDLGNSRIINPDMLCKTLTQAPGTLVYMAPEALDGEPMYNTKLDMFSYGHLALYTVLQLFPSELLQATFCDPDAKTKLMARTEVERRREYIDQLIEIVGAKHILVRIIMQCLQNDPEQRPSANEVFDVLSKGLPKDMMTEIITESGDERYVSQPRKPSTDSTEIKQSTPKKTYTHSSLREVDVEVTKPKWFGAPKPQWKRRHFRITDSFQLEMYKEPEMRNIVDKLDLTQASFSKESDVVLKIQSPERKSPLKLKTQSEEDCISLMEEIKGFNLSFERNDSLEHSYEDPDKVVPLYTYVEMKPTKSIVPAQKPSLYQELNTPDLPQEYAMPQEMRKQKRRSVLLEPKQLTTVAAVPSKLDSTDNVFIEGDQSNVDLAVAYDTPLESCFPLSKSVRYPKGKPEVTQFRSRLTTSPIAPTLHAAQVMLQHQPQQSGASVKITIDQVSTAKHKLVPLSELPGTVDNGSTAQAKHDHPPTPPAPPPPLPAAAVEIEELYPDIEDIEEALTEAGLRELENTSDTEGIYEHIPEEPQVTTEEARQTLYENLHQLTVAGHQPTSRQYTLQVPDTAALQYRKRSSPPPKVPPKPIILVKRESKKGLPYQVQKELGPAVTHHQLQTASPKLLVTGDKEDDENYTLSRPEWTKASTLPSPSSFMKKDLATTIMEALYVNPMALVGRQHIADGEFGEVYKATLNLPPMKIEVAVKTVKYDSEKDKQDFLHEMVVMSELRHPNIVRLHGLVKEDNLIVLEYLKFGDLKKFLSNHQRPVQKLVKYMIDVAMGMHYLSEKGLVHRDLAARNVMVASDETCKVSDFGLIRELPRDDEYYISTSESKCPVRWMAPESLLDRKYSPASDVWSFGILQWEMFNPRRIPYDQFNNIQCPAKVTRGCRLDIPEHCPGIVAQIMKACWNMKPEKRPSFRFVLCLLEKMSFQ